MHFERRNAKATSILFGLCILIWHCVIFSFSVVHNHSHVLCVFAVSSTKREKKKSTVCINWQFNWTSSTIPHPNCIPMFSMRTWKSYSSLKKDFIAADVILFNVSPASRAFNRNFHFFRWSNHPSSHVFKSKKNLLRKIEGEFRSGDG